MRNRLCTLTILSARLFAQAIPHHACLGLSCGATSGQLTKGQIMEAARRSHGSFPLPLFGAQQIVRGQCILVRQFHEMQSSTTADADVRDVRMKSTTVTTEQQLNPFSTCFYYLLIPFVAEFPSQLHQLVSAQRLQYPCANRRRDPYLKPSCCDATDGYLIQTGTWKCLHVYKSQ
ncbi:hypothetical protein QBC43DRAFT_322492 [Cladorrhinum sp. PSN259]|nr:hypothetical protein QBC43DRAFT_322492 [Cladorrhinum sp. PSN259]